MADAVADAGIGNAEESVLEGGDVKMELNKSDDAVAETESGPEIGQNGEVKNEPIEGDASEVKLEGEEGDGEAYMVLEEADGDEGKDVADVDNDSQTELSEEEELTENEQLRKTNKKLNERLSLLEEFIEVELSDKFSKFMKKRAHLVDVMGLEQETDDLKCNGKRSSKSLELVGLLKIANDQAKDNKPPAPRRHFNRDNPGHGSPFPSKKRPNSQKEGVLSAGNQQRCTICRSGQHSAQDCLRAVGKPENAKKQEAPTANEKPRRGRRSGLLEPRDRKVILMSSSSRERDHSGGVRYPQRQSMPPSPWMTGPISSERPSPWSNGTMAAAERPYPWSGGGVPFQRPNPWM